MTNSDALRDVLSRVSSLHEPGLSYYEVAPFDPPNPVYSAVERLFRDMGLDKQHEGSDDWNPLGDIIRPGDHVIVKPNFVSSRNMHNKITGKKLQASSTHGSLLRPVLDYALKASGKTGWVRVVDTPVEGCEIEKVIVPLGVRDLIRHLRMQGGNVDFIDMRYFRVVPRFVLDDVRRWNRSLNLGLLQRQALPGDPRGYHVVNLAHHSRFEEPGVDFSRLSFHRSHRDTPRAHHRSGFHEYGIPGTVLAADVIINLPKLKTHKKTGVTLALKSFIGLSHQKYWLPHFTAGHPASGGDEYDRAQDPKNRVENLLSRVPLPGGHSMVVRAPAVSAPPRVMDGSWEGNNTLWRTILDLNRAILFADKSGKLQETQQRRYLAIVDGIVAGEGEGPLGATPVEAGLLFAGRDPALVDYVASKTVGFDPNKIVMIREALDGNLLDSSRLEALKVVHDGPEYNYAFRPPRSWPSLLPPSDL